ncbi:conserved exported protein of unknown function [Nitrospira sp. KM1]|uniref:tetratricopeptide repeat protein n=1 Tax=Nitrospira sp. KM1 TaxID=1936990 RepID=UPI0013A779DD|nr:tetratricopeptide repeat protein [Nitrospira sp. KM1]BCA54824.1 conserved exported protein of unknown function [Nitrospira sp. KM1]
MKPSIGFAWPFLVLLLLGMAAAEGGAAETNGQAVGAAPAGVPPQPELPDDGPRFDAAVQGPEAQQFYDGVSAFRRGHYDAARAAFDGFATRNPESGLFPASVAFNAELTLQQEASNRKRAEAVNQYRGLVRAYPKDPNTVRAEWRIGDLYRAMGWFQEAKSAYEQALGRSQTERDTSRAMLGFALACSALGKWKEAELAFATVRKQASDDRMFMHATRGLASALYTQQQVADAQPLYDMLHRRWPTMMRQDAVLLSQYCAVLFDTNRMLQARDVCTVLYNMYPSRTEGGAALIRVGDSCRKLGQQKCSEVFYTVARTLYPNATAGAYARLRLTQMEQELAAVAAEDFLYMKVRGLMRGADSTYLDDAGFRRTYLDMASAHDADMLGSEALYHLAEYHESRKAPEEAVRIYHQVSIRAGKIEHDPWPAAAGDRLVTLLKPRLESALAARDEFNVVSLFHWHGSAPEQHYTGTDILLRVADIHRRQGFSAQAVHLYQSLVRDLKAARFHEEALIGLGQSYLDQRDYVAAQKVLERTRFLYPQSLKGPMVSKLLISSLRGQENYHGAAKLMRTWLRLHPNDRERASIQLMLARTLAEDRQPEEALAAFDEAVRAGTVSPTNDDRLVLADLLSHKHSPQRALELYRQVLTAHPEREEAAWAQLQIVRNLSGRRDTALARAIPTALSLGGDPLLQRATTAIQGNPPDSLIEQGE